MAYDQQVTTYDDTVPHIRVVSNIIQLIDPVDTPLIDALDGLDAARKKFKVGQNGYKVELLEDEYEPVETTANHGTTIATDATQITVADGTLFQDGSVILIDSEYMVVSAVAAQVLTVYSRSYGGTNATHAATAAISIVGMARLEGDDADYIGLVNLAAPYNYTSIYQKGLNVSDTMQAIDQYAIDNEFSYQAQKAIPEKLRLLERALFHGIRAAGSESAPRSMGGLGTFIGSNTVAAGGAIAKSDVDILAESIYIDGGMPDLFVCHPGVARDLKDLIDTSAFVQVDQMEDRLGTVPMKFLNTQYGTLRLLMDRWCPVATAYMLSTSKIGLYSLRPFGWKRLGLTGDSTKGEVVGEFSLLVANNEAHGTITGITS